MNGVQHLPGLHKHQPPGNLELLLHANAQEAWQMIPKAETS